MCATSLRLVEVLVVMEASTTELHRCGNAVLNGDHGIGYHHLCQTTPPMTLPDVNDMLSDVSTPFDLHLRVLSPDSSSVVPSCEHCESL